MLFSALIISCSRKHIPETTTDSAAKVIAPKTEHRKTIHTPTPKVIVVNDMVAKKSADGRLYYDLEGRRYWRNYDDGKYYLFNKAMYGNPAFTPH